jgi:hypothetical protein
MKLCSVLTLFALTYFQVLVEPPPGCGKAPAGLKNGVNTINSNGDLDNSFSVCQKITTTRSHIVWYSHSMPRVARPKAPHRPTMASFCEPAARLFWYLLKVRDLQPQVEKQLVSLAWLLKEYRGGGELAESMVNRILNSWTT